MSFSKALIGWIFIMLFVPAEVGAQRWGPREIRQKAFRKPARPAFRRVGYPNAVTIGTPQIISLEGLGFVTIGLEYERLLDKEGKLSVHIPLYAGYAPHLTMGLRVGQKYREGHTLFTAPGIRFHPYGNDRRADFSLGLQAAAGMLHIYDYSVGSHGSTETAHLGAWYGAALMQADLDLHPADHGIIGFHMAFGPVIGEISDLDIMFQVGLKFGGRF